MTDDLGDRMKTLEAQETARRFLPGLPIYARIDGRGFSRFTCGMNRPYDKRMSQSMINTTKVLVERTHATIGFVQSDEISLVWIPSEGGQAWFDGKIAKMTSVLAGLATSAFMVSIAEEFGSDTGSSLWAQMPHFDARVISVPSQTEAANMLLWRNLDATKNSVSMAASHYYSHQELQNKSGAEKQEMLFEKGVNFNDYPGFFKRGTFVRRVVQERRLTAEEMERIPVQHRPSECDLVTRSTVQAFDLPPLTRISNRVATLFEGAEPLAHEPKGNER